MPITTELRAEHLRKHALPMVVTELGIVSDESDEHSANVCSPIEATELPITTKLRAEHLRKHALPMVVTELGIVSDESDEQA